MTDTEPKDLFVLAADLELANALEGLLSRPRDLGIRDVAFDIERHINRDSGCRTEAVEYLRPYHRKYQHALVVFDHHGCGSMRPVLSAVDVVSVMPSVGSATECDANPDRGLEHS